MRKRIISAGLLLALLLTLLPPRVSAAETDYGWPEMQGDIAMRVTQNGAEVSRLVVGQIGRAHV